MALDVRSEEPEIMDDLNCNGPVVAQTLRELEFINKWLGGNGVTLTGLRQLTKRLAGKKAMTLADMGCGGGDMVKLMDRWGERNHIAFQFSGIDANPHIIALARENCERLTHATFEAENVFSPVLATRTFDIITATLFTHHFTHASLVELLRTWYQQTRIGLVINDLHRHPLAFHSIRILTQLFSKSDMVKFDAPLSVKRGFKRKEWELILQEAGIPEAQYQLRWKWAFRWQLVIFAPSNRV